MFPRPLYRSSARRLRDFALPTLALSLLLPAAALLAQTAVISPQAVSVHAASTQKFAVAVSNAKNSAGSWYVAGGFQNGVIDQDGTYHAPNSVPSPSTISIGFIYNGSNNSTSTTLTITNPIPVATQVAPNTFTKVTNSLLVYGANFVPGATVTVQGVSYTPSTNNGAQLFIPAVTLTNPPAKGTIPVVVNNPNPGATSSAVLNVPSSFPNGTGGPTATISPAGVSVHANGTQQFSVAVSNAPNSAGSWYVNGSNNGYIEQNGLYHAPNTVPNPSTISFGFVYNGSNNSTSSTLTITNPAPVIVLTNPSNFTQLNFPLLVAGSSFIPGATITIQGTTYTPVYNNSAQLFIPNVTLTTPPIHGTVAVTVNNPNPGAASTSFNVPSNFPGLATVSPSTLPLGWSTVSVTGAGFTPSSLVTLDGRPLRTTFVSSTALTGYGYEPAWATGSAVIGVIPQAGSPSESNQTLPVATALIPYDTAARFATQAAMGPRPDLVEHIQAIGLKAFLLEQMNLPGVAYIPNETPRLTYTHAALGSNASLLRMRVAAALNSYIPNQAIFLEYQSFVPWEQKLESDVTGNYRQILTDITSDPRLGVFLSNAGNDVSAANPNLHPTQNFSRELMQLFSLGTVLLNDDGSYQIDSSGQPLPAYDQNTVLDLSRALTGWDIPTPVNPAFTAFKIDESQVLTPIEANHDHAAKTLFGNVTLPAGQTTTQDRDQALNAIFNHPNLPPFVVQILIHHLVTSNPSPAYIQRVVNVFKDNGKGVRGDMSAVIAAILLDKEARAGDTQINPNDGFLQDPQLFHLFTISALQAPGTDGQQVYMDVNLGQNWWYPNTVFDFYPQSAAIPGTTVNSPEFTLYNNLSVLERSQFLYGIVTGSISGFDSEYQAGSWLYNAFTNVPDLVTGLNHLLYHGQMPAAEQTAIINYCSGISNQNQAFSAAIFLALNADGSTVTH